MRCVALLLGLSLLGCSGDKSDTGTPPDVDADGDGVVASEDCDDNAATTYPGAVELCDGIDNDCNGNIDNNAPDSDSDGTCDAFDVEECDGLDNDGDGDVDEEQSDTDGDGTCDALDAEECDGLDNDGDGDIDEGYLDNDGDGVADCVDGEDCDGVDNNGDGQIDEGYVDTDGDGTADCVDVEECDGLDNDGDGDIDEDFTDTDVDGVADCIDAEECDGLDNDGDGDTDEGFDDTDGDGTCDGIDTEECDGLDNDGDGDTDEGFDDTDGDGTADCVDEEECDGLDNDGDGEVDEEVGDDNDSDGYRLCDDDCDDDDSDAYPGNTEVYDLIDNDCDGIADEGFIAVGDLYITEIMIDPLSSADNKGEYFEVFNATSDDISMYGWLIYDTSGDQFTVEDDVTVPADDYAVFARRASNNGGVTADYAYDTDMTFGNGSSDELYLDIDGTVIDSVAWDGGTNWPYAEGIAMMLDPDYYSESDNDDYSYWCDASSEITSGGDLGTPGADNDLCGTIDHDGDGFTGDDGDCDDESDTVYPGADETEPGVDNDCDGSIGNTLPIADAELSTSGTLSVCDTLELDGSSSSDPDGDPIVGYSWSMVSVPTGSILTTADIDSPEEPSPFLVPDQAGTFTLGLLVYDGTDVSVQDTLDITVIDRSGSNSVPVAEAGEDDEYTATSSCSFFGGSWRCSDCESASFAVDATGSTDGDGDELRYTWSTTSTYATIDSEDEGEATITLSGIPATYGSTSTTTVIVTVEAIDCEGDTDTDTLTLSYDCTGS
ncbi:MAG: MopE-related protein [Myxococcota bacterium]|nr:MopE-related protein [Myxococcota bacterium]